VLGARICHWPCYVYIRKPLEGSKKGEPVHSMVQHFVAWRITVKCITAEYSIVQHNVLQQSIAQYSTVEYIVQARVLLSKEVSLSL
jgi:hypothetical protein